MATSRQTRHAFIKAATWGTAVSANAATAEIYCAVANMYGKPEELPDESVGFDYHEYIDAGNIIVQPVLSGDLRYTGALWRLICYCFGDDTAAIVGAGPEYTHTMAMQDETALFGTFVEYDGVNYREIPAFQPTGFTLSGESGAFWRYEIRGIGDQCRVSGQTTPSFASVTATSKVLRVPFGATTVRIDDSANAPLVSPDDVVRPSAISIKFDRAFVPEFLAQGVAEGSGEWRTRQPAEDGFPTLEVSLTFPEYNAVTYLEDMGDETVKIVDITITGPTLTNTTAQISMSFPALRVMDAKSDSVDAGKRIVESLTLRGLEAQSAPSGMTGITKLMQLVLRDAVSAAYDA